MRRSIGFACAALLLGIASSSRAADPPPRNPGVVGPIVGVGRGQPLTPEQERAEKLAQVKALLAQFEGDDENLRQFAAEQLVRSYAAALPAIEQAAKAEKLNDETRRRYHVLITALKADAKVRPAVEKYLKEKRIAGGELFPIAHATLARAFPDHAFYALRFRQYPVAYQVPDGMRPSNVLVVRPDGTVEPIDDVKQATALFRAGLAPVKDADGARAAARSWLRVSEEWRQDGFYRFVHPDDQMKVTGDAAAGFNVSANSVATGGGNSGTITATLTFGSDGKLTTATDEGTLRPGVRPICQATKLLDPDPIVRAMAEQAILVMGVRAQPYLAEQWQKAGPELRRAIERVWAQVLAEGR